MLRCLLFLLALGLTVGSRPVLADVGVKDIQVLARTIGFTAPPMTGAVKVAIIADASVAQSQKDADALKEIMGSGFPAGAATLSPVMVTPAQLDGGLDGVAIAFVTGGLAAHHGRIFAATNGKKVLTVSTDLACVQAGRCVMGIKTDPKVEIIVNKSAAEAAALSFAPAFRMMVTEL